jgi:hypothetical protein
MKPANATDYLPMLLQRIKRDVVMGRVQLTDAVQLEMAIENLQSQVKEAYGNDTTGQTETTETDSNQSS